MLLDTPDLVERIEALFVLHGHRVYDGIRQEPVSALEHALQCAELAEWAGADAPLIAAALLHDIGHFLTAPVDERDDRLDDEHEELAVPFLSTGFGPEVIEPVRLHVQAKRYLVRTDARYAQALSLASRHSLALQGGPMRDDELARFEARPQAMNAVRLRRWDDSAKRPGRPTPPLGYYLAVLEQLG